MFGGNSNWRGPIWFPTNYLLVESLKTFHEHYGDAVALPMPSHVRDAVSLDQAAVNLARRLCSLFERTAEHGRPADGVEFIYERPDWREYVTFYEYFDGDTGRGLGASHQTGWTALVATLLGVVASDGERRD